MEYPKYVSERKSFVNRGLLYYKCNICSKAREYISAHMDYHLVSQVHKKNMEKHAQYYCETCQVQCNKPVEYRRHLETKSHKQKTGVEPIEPKPELKCEPCGLKFLSRAGQLQHNESKHHKQKVGIEVKPELKCEPCGVKFLCKREEERHLLTKKHAKLTQK